MAHVDPNRTVERAAQPAAVLLLARWCAATHAALAVRMSSRDATP
jgi:hypothetical protein